MQIKVYLDDAAEPYQVLIPPEQFSLDTEQMVDGEHKLTFKAIKEGEVTSVRIIPFTVRNGPSIAVHGIVEQDTLSGTVSLLANAYGAKTGDEFEPLRMETPAPVPTWAWVLVLGVVGWGVGYITLEYQSKKLQDQASAQIASAATSTTSPNETTIVDNNSGDDWVRLGKQIYENNCASCHQGNGAGLPGIFPPLANNAVVLDDDPVEHIHTIINGLSGKEIDGVLYASPMPAFGEILNNEEIAAVVNHERTQWSNNAPIVTADDIAAIALAADTSNSEPISTATTVGADSETDITADDWKELGSQVYGNNCSSCHQSNGAGLPGVFPPLVNNVVVLDDDPSEHIKTIINGLSGKEIGGIMYPAPMPAFGSMLSDDEIAAVVNHERTQWNHNAKTVTSKDVTALR